MDRCILHCDMNGFFASVELLDYPHLKNKPMAVCGNPENRHGIILAKNEIAKRYNTTTDKLKNINNLTSTLLSIGQQLKVPKITEDYFLYTLVCYLLFNSCCLTRGIYYVCRIEAT